MKFEYPKILSVPPPFKDPPRPLIPLGGEVHLGEATMRQLRSTVVAVCIVARDQTLTHVGTGFFLTPGGLVATAKHVLDACQTAYDQGGRPVAISMDPDGSGSQFLPLRRPLNYQPADVGVSFPYDGRHPSMRKDRIILRMSEGVAPVGSRVYTCGYPVHKIENVPGHGYRASFALTCYGGEILEFFPEGRKFGSEHIGPCYVTNIAIHHANSGGPVFDKRGRVFGIASTGFNVAGSEDETPISFVTSISSMLDLRIMQDTDAGPVERVLRDVSSVRQNLTLNDPLRAC